MRIVSSEKVYYNPIQLLEENWPTPLLKLSIGQDVWAKLEFFNPFSRSIKDRTALFLFREALKADATQITEATSGNVGVALSSLSAIYGKKFVAFIPTQAPRAFKIAMKVLGTEVIEAGKSTNDLIPLVKSFAKTSGSYHLNQFNNPLNIKAHMETTAKELDEQLKSVNKFPERIIATMGTGGHIAGISKYFKEKYGEEVEIIGVQPAENDRIPGIKRQNGDTLVSSAKVDRVIDVTSKEAIEGVIKVARSSGILIGLSSGATVAAYNRFNDEKTTILIFPDDGFKYLDELERFLQS
ncbi:MULTISPECIES: cysteine synthase family protein [Metallosphaera]|uniref:cysteine synthase family protein n=1 Tax=Metallosphaera TaxID=41980 RepID=UPI001F05140C|nr:cysteine synthase family protein [Metallosphaera sedula]MCH1770015.1 cysteine synthase family protein [Metallosphaera sedula]MCP6728151.1 cysteine synthase family protein [Metallosphaera sedula]